MERRRAGHRTCGSSMVWKLRVPGSGGYRNQELLWAIKMSGMANSVYQVNKGINAPIVFKGLKAQYIWYLAGGILGLLVLFAILYIAGVNMYICLLIACILGTTLFLTVYRTSHKYGEHGIMKKMARRSVPRVVKSNSRKVFIELKRKG